MNFQLMTDLLYRMAGKYYHGIDMCIYKNGKEVYRKQAGVGEVETGKPVDPDAMYYLFSCSKVMTCAAALQLYEKGYYLLEDPISEYLPEFKDVTVNRYRNNRQMINSTPAHGPITIKHLFSMTSGINYDLTTPYIKEVIERTNGKCPTNEIVKAIAKNPLQFEPGEHYMYGLGHDVIGRLIEVLSGMSFGEYMKKNLWDPCGLKHTTFKLTDEIKAKMQPRYYLDHEKNEFVRCENNNQFRFGEDSEYESGGAGIISCVSDYIKFADAMANGGIAATGERILTSPTIDIMRTNVLTKDQIADMSKGPEGYGYGLGVRTMIDNSVSGRLTNIGEFGWDGAVGSYVQIDPKEGVALFAAENVSGPFNHDGPGRIGNVLSTILNS